MAETAKILILEDDDDMRGILTEVLEERGYQVVAVSRGLEAVEWASREPFDLIVADIRMEGMDGLEALERSKQQQPEIGSLVVSGYASEEETARADRLQVGGYLHKPFRMSQFLELVREQLKDRHQEQASQAKQSTQVRTLKWALDAMASMADEAELVGPRGTAERVGHLGRALARELQLGTTATEELGLACKLAYLAEVTPLPDFFLQDSQTLASLTTALTQPDSREGRLVQLALAAGPKEPYPSAQEMARKGDYDPEILELYERACQNVANPAESRPRPQVSGSLLSLGHAFESAGDFEQALLAYQSLVDQSEGHLQLRGLLRKARLLVRCGQPQEMLKMLDPLASRAASLGPTSRAQTFLEVGVLLLDHERTRAQEFLAQAARESQALGLNSALALARVALASLGQETDPVQEQIEHLLTPSQSDVVAGQAKWLVPALLELARRLSAPRLGLRVAGDYPGAAAQSFQRLGPEAKDFLVAAFEGAERALPEPVLKAVLEEANTELHARALALRGLASAANSLVRFASFGAFEARRGEELIEEKQWRTRKTKYLVALLASRWGHLFSEDYILDQFWPKDAEKGKRNLYWSTSIARGCLRDPLKPDFELIQREPEGLRLHPEAPHWHDVEEFGKAYEGGVKAQEQQRAEEAVAHFRRVSALYQGPFLEGCYLEWAVALRDRLEREATDAMLRLANLSLDAHGYPDAREAALKAVELAPHRQEAHLLLMRAFLGLDRPQDAIEQFQKCEKYMREEYDLEPSTDLLKYYHRARLGMGDAPHLE